MIGTAACRRPSAGGQVSGSPGREGGAGDHLPCPLGAGPRVLRAAGRSRAGESVESRVTAERAHSPQTTRRPRSMPQCHDDMCVTCSDTAVAVTISATARRRPRGGGHRLGRGRGKRRSRVRGSGRHDPRARRGSDRSRGEVTATAKQDARQVPAGSSRSTRSSIPAAATSMAFSRRFAGRRWPRRRRSLSCGPRYAPATRERLLPAHGTWRAGSPRGGRLFAFGNGGSATDAAAGRDVVPQPRR